VIFQTAKGEFIPEGEKSAWEEQRTNEQPEVQQNIIPVKAEPNNGTIISQP
jgi:hypothetical protein